MRRSACANLLPSLFTLVALVAACSAPSGQTAEESPRPGPALSSVMVKPVAFGFDGQALGPLTIPDDFRVEQEGHLEAARTAHEADPDDATSLVWIGRRLGYLGRYAEAIAAFTQGVERFPTDARFLRHRGHRHVSLRRLDQAIADLEAGVALVEGQPDQVEPDGLPNARNQPTSTLQTNLWYHLGLARYLARDWAAARDAYRACFELAGNPDMQVAAAYWLVLSLERLGERDAAQEVVRGIASDLDIIENDDYHQLLLLFRGEVDAGALLARNESGTLGFSSAGYGVGAWHLVNGRTDAAYEVFRQVVAGPGWSAFGYLAAEAELARAAD